MKKSLGSKRNEISPEQIDQITKLYSDFKDQAKCKVEVNGQTIERVCSKIFDNRDLAFIKIIVERPLRLNFQASPTRLERLTEQNAFAALVESKKRKNKKEIAKDIDSGREQQTLIVDALGKLDPDQLYRNRDQFKSDLDKIFEQAGVKVSSTVYRAILTALSERDPKADICKDAKGTPEPDADIRDAENVPLPATTALPLPIEYKGADDKEPNNDRLISLVRSHCDEYFAREVKPHWPDAWIDYSKLRVGYKIPFNRHFYVYETPRPLVEIERDMKSFESNLVHMLQRVAV
jgi:type I restriction enzyme M protein